MRRISYHDSIYACANRQDLKRLNGLPLFNTVAGVSNVTILESSPILPLYKKPADTRAATLWTTRERLAHRAADFLKVEATPELIAYVAAKYGDTAAWKEVEAHCLIKCLPTRSE